ncbi:bZIP transcription factor 60 [Diospyros lotus]|uniref:bZIP transcription factor 60 n=1 Tax=Diospyros lotus TaxID=55363 RepID=UPI00225AF8E3|nr:bZIP transcription factor 60 [Diospyros lotus]
MAVEDGVADDEIGEEIDWERLLDNIPEDLTPFDDDPSDPSDNPFSLSIGEIEQLLMEDDKDDGRGEKDQPPLDFSSDLVSEFLLDSPAPDPDRSAPQVVNDAGPNNSNSSSPSSATSEDGSSSDKNNARPRSDDNNNGNRNDPISKKQQRQLRNRDAAVRSRERRKMYVRDLELKSRYLEGECRRLGMLLQCCFAENQALRLSLQNAKAFDASVTKQESAVLLLESLLLGSLLWLLAIICLPILLGQLQFTLGAVLLESGDKKNLESQVPRKAKSNVFGFQVFPSLTILSKRCKASRKRMKRSSLILHVLA